ARGNALDPLFPAGSDLLMARREAHTVVQQRTREQAQSAFEHHMANLRRAVCDILQAQKTRLPSPLFPVVGAPRSGVSPKRFRRSTRRSSIWHAVLTTGFRAS